MMNNHQKAEQIFNQTRPSARELAVLGERNLRPIQRASLAEIEAHLDLVDAVARETGVPLDYQKFEIGATRTQLETVAASKRKQYNRRAGVRALEQKYGHEAAARIVKNHSGRTIRD